MRSEQQGHQDTLLLVVMAATWLIEIAGHVHCQRLLRGHALPRENAVASLLPVSRYQCVPGETEAELR